MKTIHHYLIAAAVLVNVVGWGVRYIDQRAVQTEKYVTSVIVDASQGFPAWRRYCKLHPEEMPDGYQCP